MLVFSDRHRQSSVEIVSWSSGSPAKLKAMLDAHDNGDINIYDYWSVGDERERCHLSAISANPNGAFTSAMDAQDITMVLMNKGYGNQQGVHFVVGQKELLNQAAKMNATNTNSGSWKDSLMRADLNNLYYNALDADFRSMFKPFDVLTAKTYDGTTNEIVQDHFALFAEKEVFGVVASGNATEANALSQIEYYKTTANRVKTQIQSETPDGYWLLRSPYSTTAFCACLNTNGTAAARAASQSRGISPFGCI